MHAFLKNYRQSPRKVRLLADLVKGKRVSEALEQLSFVPKRASLPLKKLIDSAIANAKNSGVATEDLIVKSMTVDKGLTMKRFQPTARGRATPLHKHASHVRVTLGIKEAKVKKTKAKTA